MLRDFGKGLLLVCRDVELASEVRLSTLIKVDQTPTNKEAAGHFAQEVFSETEGARTEIRTCCICEMAVRPFI